MFRDWGGCDKAVDGFGGKFSLLDPSEDNSGYGSPPERYQNHLPREELLVGLVGQCAAIFPKDFCRYHLIVHGDIIAYGNLGFVKFTTKAYNRGRGEVKC